MLRIGAKSKNKLKMLCIQHQMPRMTTGYKDHRKNEYPLRQLVCRSVHSDTTHSRMRKLLRKHPARRLINDCERRQTGKCRIMQTAANDNSHNIYQPIKGFGTHKLGVIKVIREFGSTLIYS